MSQLLLPTIPEGATQISGLVSVWCEAEQWTYFVGTYPIYSHRADDRRLFRLISAQLIHAGACRHKEIMETFGVSKSSVNRALKRLLPNRADAVAVGLHGTLSDQDHRAAAGSGTGGVWQTAGTGSGSRGALPETQAR